MERKNNKIVDVFIKSLLVFQIIILILVIIDEFLFRFGYTQTFVIQDFIVEKYYSTKSIFWDILDGEYKISSLLGIFLGLVIGGIKSATSMTSFEHKMFFLYFFVGTLIYFFIISGFLFLLRKGLNFMLFKLKNSRRKSTTQ